jgi:hypothetical protein
VTDRIDELSDRGRWFLESFDEIDLADICASSEAAAAKAQAALVRDQAVLAQVRLLIAAHRQRLQLADPVLWGKLERALKQPAELEAAGGGERA